ncbi:MAG: carboxy terminal-processing peptidase [Planctomycetaceae bacterium]|nr:carboxy terminal-processing peptidase [Planctomycetaceae bacterium]
MFRRSPRAAVLFLIAVAALVATGLVAQGGPRAEDATTAKLVAQMVEKFHISHKGLDDDVSKKTFEKLLSDLDPMKLYFLQSDIDELAAYKTQLDELTLAGNTEFAHVAFDRYLRRLDERIAHAQQLIDSEFDFTVDESIVTDAKELAWAKTNDEINDRWRKRIKYDVLSLMLDDTASKKPQVPGTPEVEAKEDGPATITEIRERLHKRYKNIGLTAAQTDESEKLEIYLSSLTHSFDPHSSYMSPNTLQDFQISMELRLEGIGAELRSEDGYVTVNRVVEGGAAHKDGRLKAGDKIIGVRQSNESQFTDVVEMKLTKVVQLIRGKAGTKVILQVKTAGGDTKEYELTRQQVELNDAAVRGEILDTGKRIGDRSYRVGVINIPSFYRDFQGAQAGTENYRSTSRDVLKVLKSFKEQGGVDGIVIDLRTNGGGALTEAIEVTGLFIDQGPVVQVKEQDGSIKSQDDVDPAVAYTGPLVVLCNRLSASASEIFAAAIKDYKRGIVVGDTTTHGKGTVQSVMPVPPRLLSFLTNDESRGALKLTISKFYRVNGDSTQRVGVPSDVVLPSMIDHFDLGEEFLDNALPFDRVKAADYRPVPALIGDGLLSDLRQKSAQRIANDAEFQKLNKQIVKFLERKEEKTISLNEETRRAEQEEVKQQSEVEEKLAEEEAGGADKPIFPENFYNKEVLQITADYLEQLKGAKTAGT